ncbi:MAG: chromosome segregation protein SMC [Thermodesulfobacteriota bacterium]
MKIKRLNIFGFKSFVDKTSFTFPRGITSVVGPNGCGKSNIVDAIRWVLGEQGAKSLRGKAMDDVIFNGSERRRPTGMAEVILTFSNEDGLAPPGYEQHAEISIKRRLYRSGESEYYINNALCRLKDIVELFMDTGIGSRAYSIVEQGYVDWLINSKPEDRRSLIEEVAGVHKYKARKNAALRKLEATEQNLLRVKDIIVEVKRQMNSLKYQARKAKNYKTIKDKIKDIECFLWAEEYNALKIKRESVEEEIENLKCMEMETSTNLSNKEDVHERIKLASFKKDDELRSARERLMKAEGALKEVETDMEVSQAKIDNFQRELSNLKRDIEYLNGSKERLEEERLSLREAKNSLSKDIEERERELHKKEELLNVLLTRLSPEQAVLKEKKQSIIDVITELTSRKNNISYLETAKGDLKRRLEKNQRDGEDIKRLLSVNNGCLRKLSEQLVEFKKKGEGFKKVLKEGLMNLEEIKEAYLKKDKELNTLKDEFNKRASRLDSLKELDRTLEGFDSAVKSIMERGDSEEGKERGIHGVVADIIEPQPRYERAVEAVLGERLQYMIVEGQREGLEAVQYLKTVESGRGGFIPVKVREKEVKKTAPKPLHPKVENHLLDCVKVRDGYTSIANHLLRDVVVVEDIHSAIDVWGGNGFDKTFVTLEGDIIDCWGVLLGGSLDNGKGSGILKRRREIKELSSVVEKLTQRQHRLEAECCELSNRLSDKELEIEKLKEENHEREKEEIAWEKEYNRLEGENAHLESRQEILDLEREEFLNDLDDLSARLKQSITEKAEIEIRKTSDEGSLNLLEEKVKHITEEIDSSNSIVTELRVDLASWKEKREALYNASLKADEQFEDIERRLVSIRRRCIVSEEDKKRLTSHIEALKGVIEKVLRDKDILRMEMIKREEEYKGIIEEIKGMEDGIAVERRKLSGLDKEASNLQLTFKELEMNLKHLKEKVSERYQENIDAYIPLEGERFSKEEARDRLVELQKRVESFGEVNLAATEELIELENRHNFLSSQQDDLSMSIEGIHKAIGKINRITRKRFKDAFDTINEKFREVYARFFEGGKAELKLTDESDLLESGVDIVAQPLGKKLQSITLLSGGEKALTALSLIFSVFLIKPSPFCLLDEADAPLDDANILRFNNMIKGLSKDSQFVLITHNKKTMEIADTLFGVTMEESGVSKLLSVNVVEQERNREIVFS